jgi:hypothetical protein
VKQLTDAEKQELETKIQKEKERQQALRERNPDLPETLEVASAKTGLVRRFGPRHLWKYGFLAIYPENHQFKLSMGFAVEPMERDEKCLGFVMPLKPTQWQ